MVTGADANPVEAVAWSWYEAKIFVEHATAISSDALHIIVGAVLHLALAVLFRVTVSSWRPWLALLVLLTLNEAVDLWVEQWPIPAMQYGESAKDLVTTMFLPTLLMACARLCPQCLSGRGPSR